MNDSVISIILNLDTRPGFLEAQSIATTMMNGPRSLDFFTEGIRNKWLFFKGREIEIIVFIDQHEEVPAQTKEFLFKALDSDLIHSVVFSRHREFFNYYHYYPKWNDINYMNALFLARGKYVAHFDADTVAFIKDPSVILEWIQWLEEGKYDYISYPSHWSPRAIDDPTFDDYMWASTRFFFCKRDTIPFDETLKCLQDSGYLYTKYGEKKRKCPWTEHVLGIISGKVYYPPIQLDRYAIFSFSNYQRGVLSKLNDMTYDEVKRWIEEKNGIQYPVDVWC
jgi:hypothetical protein